MLTYQLLTRSNFDILLFYSLYIITKAKCNKNNHKTTIQKGAENSTTSKLFIRQVKNYKNQNKTIMSKRNLSSEAETFLIDRLLESMPPHNASRAIKKEMGVTLSSSEVMEFYADYTARLVVATRTANPADLSNDEHAPIHIDELSYDSPLHGLKMASDVVCRLFVNQTLILQTMQKEKIDTGKVIAESEYKALKSLLDIVAGITVLTTKHTDSKTLDHNTSAKWYESN